MITRVPRDMRAPRRWRGCPPSLSTLRGDEAADGIRIFNPGSIVPVECRTGTWDPAGWADRADG
jgi:hypothetical protein